MYKPRNYQAQCLIALQNARDQGKCRALIVMASGLGKTLTCVFDIREYLKTVPNGRILVLCHSAAILTQTKETFKSIFGDEFSYGMYNGYEKAIHQTDFLFANLQSVNLHSDEFAPDEFCYVVVDEAHHSPAETYRKAIEHFTPQFLLGMTATPDRMDDANLSAIFGDTVYEYRLESAVKDGWLSDIEYRIKTDEIQRLEAYLDSGEKFSLARLNREVFVPKRDEEIVRIIREEISGKDNPTMVIFCQTIAHADKFAELMGDAVVIHSGLEDKVIKERLASFRSGSIKTVCTVDMLNEGIDVPRTDVIVFLRVTQSKIVFTQQLGRGLRRAKGKDKVLVLDFVSTADRLEMLYQFEHEFKSVVGQYPRKKNIGEREYFTLNIDAPVFKDREVDIIALIEKARSYGKYIITTNQELINLLREKAKELNRTPYVTDFDDDPNMPSASTFHKRFGSWNKALEAAGLPINIKRGYSDDELITLLRKKTKELGRTPTRREATSDPNIPSAKVFTGHFGNWNQALEAAGLSINQRKNITDEELLDLLQKEAEKLGRTPSISDIRNSSNTPSPTVFIKRFGSWNTALEMAGISIKNKTPTHHTDEELITLLRKKAKELGRTPLRREISKDPNMPAMGVFEKRFGSFKNACKVAGLSKLIGTKASD